MISVREAVREHCLWNLSCSGSFQAFFCSKRSEGGLANGRHEAPNGPRRPPKRVEMIKKKVLTNTQTSMLFNSSFYTKNYENLLFKANERVLLGKAPVDLE